MSELKISCEECGQNMLVDTEQAGRRIPCPSCGTQLTIPDKPGKPVGEAPAQGRNDEVVEQDSDSRAATERASSPREKESTAPSQPSSRPQAEGDDQEHATSVPSKSTEPAPKRVQIAVLTPDVKRDVVRLARKRISDRSKWMPGTIEEGRLIHAVKQSAEGMTPVEIGSGEATHYSLMGAVLLELDQLNVTLTAEGRGEFLGQEIPEAVRKASGKHESESEAESREKLNQLFMSASHAQCMEACDLLERLYTTVPRDDEDSPVLRERRGASLDELMTRAAQAGTISSTELLRAVYYELEELKRRLAELEKSP